MLLQTLLDGTLEPVATDQYYKLRGEIGHFGDFALMVSLIVVETGDFREFWTPDGQMIGRVRRKEDT